MGFVGGGAYVDFVFLSFSLLFSSRSLVVLVRFRLVSPPGLCWVSYYLALSHYLESFTVCQLRYSFGGTT